MNFNQHDVDTFRYAAKIYNYLRFVVLSYF